MKTIEINGLKLRVEDGLEVVIEGDVITIRARQQTITIQPYQPNPIYHMHPVYPPQPTTTTPGWPSSIPQITCVS